MKAHHICLSIIIWFVLSACSSDTLNHLPGVDPWMDGNLGEFSTFSDNVGTGPVSMLNLLKFRELSLDGNGTGAESYARYGELARPFVVKHGGELISSSKAGEHLVGDTDYDWDMVLIVKWPDRQNLLDLIDDEGYKAIAHHRKNGLERTMLIALNSGVLSENP